MALSDLQKEAYRAVLRAVAATQLDWVCTGLVSNFMATCAL